VKISTSVKGGNWAATITTDDATDDEQVALAVYRRLAGGSVGLIEGPTAGDPLDAIHSADFQYTFDAAVATDSTLVFSIRRDVADAAPVIELTGGAITSIVGQSPTNPSDGSIVRLSATQCRARIKARSLVLIPPGQYCAEFRELSAAGDTLSKHEIGITFRRGASRRQA
jgi:hypothetical protein